MVNFISIKRIKELTYIEGNVDEDKLNPFRTQAQDINLQQVIGSELYNDLKDKIRNNTLTTDDKELIEDYIHGMLANWTVYYAIPFINFQFTNKAITKAKSALTPDEFAGLDEVKYIRNETRNVAEFYTARLVKYLLMNLDNFPKCAQNENLNQSARTYFSGLYIPKRR